MRRKEVYQLIIGDDGSVHMNVATGKSSVTTAVTRPPIHFLMTMGRVIQWIDYLREDRPNDNRRGQPRAENEPHGGCKMDGPKVAILPRN